MSSTSASESVIKLGNAAHVLLPEKPIEPLDSECCGTGCTPCVFDIYKKQLTKWEVECETIRRNGITKYKNDKFENNTDVDTGMTPYEYNAFKVIGIVDDAADSIKIFRFDASPEADNDCNSCDSMNFPVEVGQHVVVKIGQLSRQYTVLRVCRTFETCQFEILIKIYPEGPMTQLLNQVSVGSCLEMRGPFGQRYEYKPNTFHSIVMLAAGTGFAPMYRIIENILDNECDDTRIKLLFSCKSIDDAFLRAKFSEWASFWNFKAFYYFSSPSASESTTTVPYGIPAKFQRLNLDEIKEKCSLELSSNPLASQFLICGTKSFEKDMINYLRKLEVNTERIQVF